MDLTDLIYLDHAAATPLLPEAAEAMAAAYRDAPGNPSALGKPGRAAARELRRARERLARVLAVKPDAVIFTSGGTESIGLALLGTLGERGRGHVVTSAIEHPAVLGSLKILERRGLEVTRVRPERNGVVDPQRFADAVTDRTVAACLMHVNNELGTLQPVAETFAAVKARAPRCLTFVDAVQSFTRVPVEPTRWQADLVALSGHKVGGPRGIGALVALGRLPDPLMGGGDQERGVRPGTENVPAAAGFVAAVQQKLARLDERLAHAAELAGAFTAEVAEHVPTARINGDPAHRTDFILSVSVPGLPSEALLRSLDEHGVCVSAGAACHARSQKQSHVLEAIGVDRRTGTIRVSFGPGNTVEQVRRAVQALAATVQEYAIP